MAGFAAIALGWAGAAPKTCVDCQIPYLISGGTAGSGLVALGTGLLLMAQKRTEARRLSCGIDHMTWTLAERFMGGPGSTIESTRPDPAKEPTPTLVHSGGDRDWRDPDLGTGP